jgi:hypothetical protein
MSKASERAASAPWQPKWMTITGWVLTGLVTAIFILSAGFKFTVPLQIGDHVAMAEQFRQGRFSVESMTIIGVVELTCALIYCFPRTAVLGAALLNGYLGGAIVVHINKGELILAPLIIGIIVWLGVYLREPRLRAIMPWR